MKKITIIGSGTAGVLSAMHFLKWAPECELELYHDPNIKPQSVGEGAALDLPVNLTECLDFQHSDLATIDGSFKYGIRKIGWGDGTDFVHHFPPPMVSYHFNAVKLQEYVLGQIKDKVTIKEGHVTADELDSDFIMDCSGKPTDYTDFNMSTSIPVNAVYVTQCYWAIPTFQYTLTIARPYGWVFGIPLTNRCSIGYMYNDTISTLAEVIADVQEIFAQFNLVPSQVTSSFSFKNYCRKQNFTDRIAYNGNSSFFLEPMEATSISTMNWIQRLAYEQWLHGVPTEHTNRNYKSFLNEVEIIIMLHYFAKSKYKTLFWDFAYDRANAVMQAAVKTDSFKHVIHSVKNRIPYSSTSEQLWPYRSYLENIVNLNLLNKLSDL